MSEVIVRHAQGQYPVRFVTVQEAVDSLQGDVFVVTDRNVWEIYGNQFPDSCRVRVIEPGEPSKSAIALDAIWRWLAQSGATRQSTVAAFGGGVVGDLAGFAAATYMRGIGCVQIATTLMAMVDSSVGGKVGIDLPEGKNLAGSFHAPIRVEICVDALRTLPERHLRNGMAEVIKYAFIADPGLLRAVEGQIEPLWDKVIRRCVEIKAGIVERDEFETTSERATLNFGHTVGHAIEALTGYGELLHGEAVAIGMVAESFIASALGLCERATFEEISRAVRVAGLPVRHDSLSNPKLVDYMLADKKRTSTGLAFSFVARPGTCKLIYGVSETEVRSVLQSL